MLGASLQSIIQLVCTLYDKICFFSLYRGQLLSETDKNKGAQIGLLGKQKLQVVWNFFQRTNLSDVFISSLRGSVNKQNCKMQDSDRAETL